MSVFSDRTVLRLKDVVFYADEALDYIGGMSVAVFAADRKTVLAVERCLQCVTEAIIQIGEEDFAIVAPFEQMSSIRGMGNMLRHEYRRIDPHLIFRTVLDDLPALRDACEAALKNK